MIVTMRKIKSMLDNRHLQPCFVTEDRISCSMVIGHDMLCSTRQHDVYAEDRFSSNDVYDNFKD
jgi:hypothetical protein